MAFYPSPEDELWERERVQKLLGLLTERQREVVVMRWGLGEEPGQTYKEVGDRLGISHTRAMQLEARALQIMEDRVDFIDSGLTSEEWKVREAEHRSFPWGRYRGRYGYKHLRETASRVVTERERDSVHRLIKRMRLKSTDPLDLGIEELLQIGSRLAKSLGVSRVQAMRVWRDVTKG